MALVRRAMRAVLLLALLLAVASSPAECQELCPRRCRCPRRGLLDCRHAGLATVPAASRRRALTALDFTGNGIATFGKEAWKEYPWTETLVLRDNELQAVKSHSLEGLFLLKHLDLSDNRIVSIEERAFEPLPFLRILNLRGNGLTQLPRGTFQAWHRMQFLEKLILSHNPLTVIADTAFFKLPSVTSLDLSATPVTAQTLLLLLQTTVHLETLKVPMAVACCLCQEHPSPETPGRTIRFVCENLCRSSSSSSSSSAPCAVQTGPVAQTLEEGMDVEQSRGLKSRPVLNLKAKEPSLGDHGTVTLGIARSLSSTEGDVSSLKDSRTTSYPPQHLSRQEGKTTVDELMVQLSNKLHKAKSIMTVKSIITPQPQPVREKNVKEKTPSGLIEKQLGSRLNWQALTPWDGAGGLDPPADSSIFGQHRGVQVAASPGQLHVRTTKEHKKSRDSHYRAAENPLFYQAPGPAPAQGEPPGSESKAEQGLNRNLDILSDPLVNSPPAAPSRAEHGAEGEPWAPGGHFPITPGTTETPWQDYEEGSGLLHEPGSSEGPEVLPVPGEGSEPTVEHELRLLVPDEGLRTFMAHVERALRRDCSLPGVQLACAKMVSKTGLLLSLLSKRQETEGAFAFVGMDPIEEDLSTRTALEKGKDSTVKEANKLSQERLLFSVMVLIFFITYFLMHCLIETCSQPDEEDSRSQKSSKSWLRRSLEKLPCAGRKEPNKAEDVEQGRGRNESNEAEDEEQGRWSKEHIEVEDEEQGRWIKEYIKAKEKEQGRARMTYQDYPTAHSTCSAPPLPALPFHGDYQYLPIPNHLDVKPNYSPEVWKKPEQTPVPRDETVLPAPCSASSTP